MRPFHPLSLPHLALLSGALSLGACTRPPIHDDPDETDQVLDANSLLTGEKDKHWQHTQNTFVDNQMATLLDGGTPGCAVGVVKNNELYYLKGYGKTLVYQGPDWGYESMAPVASISKTFTAIAIMKLAEMGELGPLGIQSTVGDHLSAGWNLSLSQVTLEQLLTHRTGIGRDVPSFSASTCAEYPGASRFFCRSHPELAFRQYLMSVDVRFDSDDDLDGTPAPQVDDGVNAYYSNLGYAILGAVIDRVTRLSSAIPADQKGYEPFIWHLIGNHVDNPNDARSMLSMALSHPWRSQDIPDYVNGHCATGNCEVWEDGTNSWVAPGAHWTMTIGDLTRFVRAQINGEILSASSWADVYSERTLVDDIDKAYPAIELNYGLGVATNHSQNPTYHFHGGDGRGHSALWFIERGATASSADDIGVAIVCNRKVRSQDKLLPAAKRIATNYGGVTTSLYQVYAMTTSQRSLLNGLQFEMDATTSRLASHKALTLPLAPTSPWTFTMRSGRAPLAASVSGITSPNSYSWTRNASVDLGILRSVDRDHVQSQPQTIRFDTTGGSMTVTNARFTFGFNADRRYLTDADLSGTVDLRQLSSAQGRNDAATMCATSLREDRVGCHACSDGVKACLSVTWDRLVGKR